MHASIDRRAFLHQSARLAGAVGAAGLLSACTGQSERTSAPQDAAAGRPAAETAAELFEISLAEWSLHRRLRGEAQPALDHLDFAAAARGFGIDAVEYVNSFFKEKAQDQDYLREMKRRADGEGVRSLLIMCDGEGRLGDPDEAQRQRAVDNHKRWVEAARFLGCHAIRVNADSRGSYDEQIGRSAEGLRLLCEVADPFGIDVIVENHGGLSSNGAWLAAVIERVGHPRAGTLPDFGNFDLGGGQQYDRYRGVAELMPYAKAVSAKSHDFDAAGEEIHTDYRRMLEIVVGAGYHGRLGIEYEGKQLSEADGILATKRLLERVRSEMA